MRCLWIGELRCEPGTMRVAPFTDVKSSSSQMVLHTQKPASSATGLASQCSGWHFRDQGSLDRAFRLLNLKIFAENMADGTRHRGIGNHTLEDLAQAAHDGLVDVDDDAREVLEDVRRTAAGTAALQSRPLFR